MYVSFHIIRDEKHITIQDKVNVLHKLLFMSVLSIIIQILFTYT